MTLIMKTIVIFMFFSILGWLLEMSYRSIVNKKLINPGFLHIPFLPIYGFASLFIYFIHISDFNDSIIIKFFTYLIALSILEFSTGYFVNKIFNTRLWDYRDQMFNIDGHICLGFSIVFASLSLVLDLSFGILLNNLTLLYQELTLISNILIYASLLIIIIDYVLTWAKRLYGKYYDIEELEQEFLELSREIIKHPKIRSLDKYNHHFGKSRLDHVLDVAWLSFKISKYFSLNSKEIVRASILHDLFYYDWLREGPKLHGFRHPAIALKNAEQIYELTEREKDIILKHMWPLTVVPPKYLESWIVSFVDTYSALKDYFVPATMGVVGKKINYIEKLNVTFPFNINKG